MNSWGDRFRLSIWGESHGQQVGVSIDGVPAGIALSEEDFTADLERRRAGAAGTTPRKESDTPHIVSGVYNGFTTGSPLTIEFLNENTRSGDYRNLTIQPRPSHADWVAQQKWGGYNDPRGGGHFSGRITLGMVAAGVVAKKILGKEVKFSTNIIEIGGSRDKEQWDAIISSAQQSQDSVGGVVECRVQGVKAGLGEPFFDSVESLAAHLLFSVPAVKGVEFGAGFEAARMRGSEHNDTIISADG
ncbi:MAG: chorismate synthase, partial [Alistipes sp.]|nr:chorismate synthase [Alistipes sp.]